MTLQPHASPHGYMEPDSHPLGVPNYPSHKCMSSQSTHEVLHKSECKSCLEEYTLSGLKNSSDVVIQRQGTAQRQKYLIILKEILR